MQNNTEFVVIFNTFLLTDFKSFLQIYQNLLYIKITLSWWQINRICLKCLEYITEKQMFEGNLKGTLDAPFYKM